MAAVGLLVLRLTLAVVLFAHGAHTLFGMWAGPGVGPGGLSNAAVRLTNLGLEPGFPIAALTGFIQVAGALLLGLGWLTRWAAAAVLLRVLIDVWIIYRPAGFFLNWTNDPMRGHGMEYAVLIAAALLCLLLTGAGDISFDSRRARRLGKRASERERLRRRL
jgi:putative oxidoreductase